MDKSYNVGKIEVTHFFRPGECLDDLKLKKMHNALVGINERSGANVVNKMLEKTLSIPEIKTHFKNTIVAIISRHDEAMAFLVSPILQSNGKTVVHSGLIVAEKNPGVDLISLLAIGNFDLGQKAFGKYFTTNISSTPSIIESFSTLIPGTWPHPDAKLKVIPHSFKEVVKILKDDYMDKYFPDPEKLLVNYKRFTLTSNSQEMGFVTDFYKISRSDSFKFIAFCHAWINYGKEEDIIQVGEINFFKMLRMKFLLWGLKKDLKVAEAKLSRLEESAVVEESQKKAA